MTNLVETVTAVLEPHVGPVVAGTCLGATAIALGKTRDELTADDLPTLEHNIRRLLAPVAPEAAIDAAVADIKRVVL